jgi:hypothetical protein
MARLLYLPLSSGLATFALAFSFLSVQTFLNAAPIQSGINATTPVFTVNHFRKGDRLPVYQPDAAPLEQRAPTGLQSQKKVPFGCDPSFSPVASPAAAGVYGRCTA